MTGMGGRRLLVRVLFLCAFMLVSSFALFCAQMEAPSGGPVDTTKPYVSGLYPDSGSVGVEVDTISILFSKKMDRRSVRDWLFISPPLRVREGKWDDNRLDLILAAPLDSGTTYSILLGFEVKDVRGNPLGPYEASFSTGDALDDGRVEGKVLGGRLRSAGVYLYVWPWSDSLDFTEADLPPPLRMGQAANDGSFEFASMPTDLPLRICALYDVDKNRSFDPADDIWGCIEQPFTIDDTSGVVTDVEVYLVLADEPGLISGVAVDSSCVGRGVVILERLDQEADSLTSLVLPDTTARPDTLVGFERQVPGGVDTTAVLARLVDIDSLRAIARADSARCSDPVIVQLFESDTVLVAETRGTGDFSFAEVPPGVYEIRAFRDSNGNGVVDVGEVAGAAEGVVLKPGRQLTDSDITLEPIP